MYLSKFVRHQSKILPKNSIVMTQGKLFATSRDYNYQLLQLDEVRSELRKSAEKFSQDEVAPLAAEIDKSDVFPQHLWKKMGDMGFLGLTAEEEFGGAGLGYYEHCLVTEEISKASGSVGISYIAHSNLCVN